MDIDKLFNVDQVPDSLFDSVNNTVSEARAMQKKKAAENAQAVIQALQKMKGDLEGKYDNIYSMLESRIASIQDGRDGIDGRDGRNGRDGKDGKDGAAGRDGRDGVDGINGLDGADGISIADIRLDFDNSLVITLSNGREINAGEILPPDISDRLKVIINQGASGGGGSGGSLPDQTGNSGKFLTTDGTEASWGTPAGSGDVVGPASATDNAIARFNTTTGKLIQNSVVTVGDTGGIAGATSIGTLDYADFDITPTVTNAVGRLYWNDAQTTLAVGLTSAISADIGQTMYARATNAEASTISKGQPVYMFAATGNRVSVKLAYNTTDATSAKTFGLAAEDITAGATGMILCQGVLGGLNTGSYTAGDTVYLGATAGTLTATKPYAPNHLVYIGVVERANNGNGQIYVRVQNGYEMDELHNVSAQNPTNGQVLIYNETTSLWEKANLTAGSNITITNAAGAITIASSGGGGSSTILENEQTISSNYTISSAKNGLSVGPVTVNTGVAVTVGTGQKWLVLN